MPKTFVIVNPSSAGGLTMRRWPRLSEELERSIGKFEYDFTNAEGVATILANEAVKKGFRRILTVGGDGTVNEVLQGLFSGGEMIDPEVVLGMIPSGTGVDLARSLALPSDPFDAVSKLKGAKIKKIDAGEARFTDHRGETVVRHFINLADAGFGGEVVDKINVSSKALGGVATYFMSALLTFKTYSPKSVRIISAEKTLEEKVMSVLVANGPYYGGGMRLAPLADVSDGSFDVIVMKAVSKRDLISIIPKLYSGKILNLPSVVYFRTSALRIETSEDVLISLDGEQPGLLPADFKVLPRAVNFLV